MEGTRTTWAALAAALVLGGAASVAAAPPLPTRAEVASRKKLCEQQWPARKKSDAATTRTCAEYWLLTYPYAYMLDDGSGEMYFGHDPYVDYGPRRKNSAGLPWPRKPGFSEKQLTRNDRVLIAAVKAEERRRAQR